MLYFAQLGCPVKAKHLLLEVLDRKGSKDTPLRPNTDSFSLVIKSWIKMMQAYLDIILVKYYNMQ